MPPNPTLTDAALSTEAAGNDPCLSSSRPAVVPTLDVASVKTKP